MHSNIVRHRKQSTDDDGGEDDKLTIEIFSFPHYETLSLFADFPCFMLM
jgi:hypothetical protein